MTTKKYSAVIFDMDGTVLNTLDDLTDALNHALKETGHDHAYTTADVRNFFGSGVTVAITRALAIEQGLASYDELEAVGQPGDKITPQIDLQEVSRIQDLYKPYYAAHCSVKTGEYDGINAMVRRLREQGIKVAVVSNKPDPAVQDLAADYFPNLFDKVIGEQPQIRHKPAPDMVQKALSDLGIAPNQAVYVGDSEIDIQTAHNSGLDCISVTWGFRPAEFLKSHGASILVDRPADIAAVVLGD